jgi:hypothetical protein
LRGDPPTGDEASELPTERRSLDVIAGAVPAWR